MAGISPAILLFLGGVMLLAQTASAQNKVVCYFINWAFYREGEGKQLPEDIDPHLCTNIIYAFAVLDSKSLELKSSDSWVDIDNNFYKRVVDLKKSNPSLKVSLAIGGWSDSAGDKYSRLVKSSSTRKNFINKVVPFLKKYGFDGLDLDWEYPRCWQADCKGPASDKANFAHFVQELREAFNKQNPKMLLSAAVAAPKYFVDQSYDVPALGKNLDFINVMTYDMRNYNDGKTGHHAAFKAKSGDEDQSLNVVATLDYWQQKGAPKHKLIMGIPAYGRSFTLKSSSSNGFGAATSGPGNAGPITKEKGFLGFYEICKNIKSGWTKKRDGNAGPYAFKGNQWTGFDDPESITVKANHVKSRGFGGMMVWDLAMDDFRGKCCKVRFPLINTMKNAIRGGGVSAGATGC